jgi:hypothetical protein
MTSSVTDLEREEPLHQGAAIDHEVGSGNGVIRSVVSIGIVSHPSLMYLCDKVLFTVVFLGNSPWSKR